MVGRLAVRNAAAAAPTLAAAGRARRPDALATIVRELTVRYDNLFELLAEVQRDLTPEQAAAALRAVPALHYRAERADHALEPAP